MSRTISQRRRSRNSPSRPAPLMRTTAVNTPAAARSGVVLEGQREPRAKLHHLAVLDLDVELADFRDAQVAQRLRCHLDRVARGVLPGHGAGADHLRNTIDRIVSFGHGSLSSSLVAG